MKIIIVLLTTTLLFIGCLSMPPPDRPIQNNNNTDRQDSTGRANQASTERDEIIYEDDSPKRNTPNGYVLISDEDNEVICKRHDEFQNVTFYQQRDLRDDRGTDGADNHPRYGNLYLTVWQRREFHGESD